MKPYILCISLILILSACKEEQAPIPLNKMAGILTDIHMAEAFAQLVPIDNGDYQSKNNDTLRAIYSHIYKQNGLDTASFNSALNWYNNRPELFDKVYEEVLTELSIRKEQFADSNKASSDSISKIIKDSL